MGDTTGISWTEEDQPGAVHLDVDADAWRDEAWDIVRRSPQHTFQILTKRPGRIARSSGRSRASTWPGSGGSSPAARAAPATARSTRSGCGRSPDARRAGRPDVVELLRGEAPTVAAARRARPCLSSLRALNWSWAWAAVMAGCPFLTRVNTGWLSSRPCKVTAAQRARPSARPQAGAEAPRPRQLTGGHPINRAAPILLCIYLLAVSVAVSAARAAHPHQRHPRVHAPARRAPWPSWWLPQALCIHSKESTDWHRTTSWTGAPSPDHGGMQIDVGTWRSMLSRGYRLTRGFPGDPAWASRREQLVVAWLIWESNGGRFGGGQWPNTAEACGLR